MDKYKDMSKGKSNFGAIPKKYAQTCSTLGLKQLTKHPLKITCHTWTLIDHIIASCEKKVTQNGVIDTSLSDHLKTIVKTNSHKQISFR